MPEKHGHGGGWEMEPLPLLLQSILAVPYFGSWYTYEGIPGGAQYLTLQKLFWDASSVILLFSNPTPKTKTGTVSRRETINRKACGRIIMTGPIETGSTSQIRSDPIYYTLYRQVHDFAALFNSLRKLWNCAGSNQHICTFLYSILLSRVTYWAQLGTTCTMALSYTSCSTWMQH